MDIQVQITNNIGNVITVSNDPKVFARTYLTNNYTGGATNLNVDNTQEFQANTLVMLENIGAANAEFVTLSAVLTQNEVTTSATLFSHNTGSVIQSIDYDQIVVYKSATINGSYTVFTTSLIQAT